VIRGAIEALAVAVKDPVDAPIAVVLVTEGFPPDERSRTRTTTMRSIARSAALSNVPVYVIDPSLQPSSTFTESWHALTSQTGGALFAGVSDLDAAFLRVAQDLQAQYLVRFESSGRQDGGFHDLQVRAMRKGTSLRAPTGYWAPFPAPKIVTASATRYRDLLTPHISGLLRPYFRMSPGHDGRTRVTFAWSPQRTDGRAANVRFAALSFEGVRFHEASVRPGGLAATGEGMVTSFEVAPGPLQISMAVTTAAGSLLDTDVRYLDVPNLNGLRPVIAGVDFIRPRSLPEFTALARDPNAFATEVRDFHRQDRLLIRVRAYSGQGPATVEARLLNQAGHRLLELPSLGSVDGASQFDLSLARYARGEYRLEVRASNGSDVVTQLLTVRLIG
jgi:hypothetical protein